MELEGHFSPRPKSHRSHIATLQVSDLDHAVRIFAFEEPRGLHRVVLSVAVSARRAVDEFRAERLSSLAPFAT
jgi:hypothetical protein